jgi:3-dehydrosphinganine reductase
LLGANILLLARGREGLESAQKEMLAARQAPTQAVDILCVDLTKPDAVGQFAAHDIRISIDVF